MSPSMKSKSKSKGGKDQRKATPKTSGVTNNGSGNPTTHAYNPVSGTFHTLETALSATSTPTHDKSRFQNIDDSDELPSSLQGTVSECDSISNNDSCSGESEDPKEKILNHSMRPDNVPGSDNDRREKIRLKNERKHQRQKERRAQELHDRCCGYLMSRKLESLAEVLVSMGFSSEQATLALMLNDGKLEESVSWLFESSETHTPNSASHDVGSNLRINIGDELARISDIEVRYNCSKQEVERVVVANEGDLQKAENTLKSQKLESFVTQPKPEDNSTQISGLMIRSRGLPTASVSMQQREIEGDFNYLKVGGSASIFSDPQGMNLQSLHLNNPMSLEDKRWGVTRSSPSAMYTLASSARVLSPSTVQQGIEREPVITMQRRTFTNGKQDLFSSLNDLPPRTTGLYANCTPAIENMRLNEKFLQNHNIENMANENMEQFYQAHCKGHPYMFGPVNSSSAGVGGFCKPTDALPFSSSIHRGSWTVSASSPSLTFPPSLGLFSNKSAARTFSSHSLMDWNTGGLMPEFDYTSVDWTLDCPSSSNSSGLWVGISSLLRNGSVNRMSSSCMAGLQNVGIGRDTSSASSSTGLREWTSPFAGDDMFSLPRQFVTSPPQVFLGTRS